MKARHRVPLACAAALLLPVATAALAQQDPRIDASTGADRAHYPPARHLDHLHLRLEIDIPDMDDRRLSARETLTVTPIGRARDEVRLDAVGLEIGGVRVRGRTQAFEHDGREMRIRLDKPIEMGETVDVVIDYEGRFPHASGSGLTWTLGNPDAASLTDRSPQIHTQGQPESNSLWFPCHDFPNERLTTELIVTVDDDYQVCANGRLVSRDATEDGRTTWRWLQDKPHSTYLVVMVVGRFAVIGLGGNDWDRPEVPLTVYAPVGFAETITERFSATPRMIRHFETLFDEPYPWDKYAQLLVRRFAAGAMENTSATTFNQGLAMAGDVDGIIAHELVHQWMGDLVAYESWEHLWLGEGWATFGEALWAEADAPPGESRDAYYRVMYSQLGATRINDTFAPRFPGLASRYYPEPDSNFYKPNNPYTKGALVLHMLRMRLGDEVFFGAVADYIDRYKFETVETDDFRRVLEEASGQSLERFFRQWVVQPGMPHVSVELDWDADAGRLTVAAEQTQRIDADNPAYAFVLPIYLTFEDGSGRYVYLPMETRTAEAGFDLDAEPVEADVDPNMRVAAHARVTKPLAMWLRQVEHGPTLIARARAAEVLGAFDDPLSLAAVERARAADPFLGAVADAHAARRLGSGVARSEEVGR